MKFIKIETSDGGLSYALINVEDIECVEGDKLDRQQCFVVLRSGKSFHVSASVDRVAQEIKEAEKWD